MIFMQYVKDYSKNCVKPPLSKRQNIGFQDQSSINAGQKYCRIAFCNTVDLHLATICYLDLCFVYFGVAVLHRFYYMSHEFVII